jgi:hypothetical protein
MEGKLPMHLFPRCSAKSKRTYLLHPGGEESLGRNVGEPDEAERGSGEGRHRNRTAADGFAANVFPMIGQIQASRPTTLWAVAEA